MGPNQRAGRLDEREEGQARFDGRHRGIATLWRTSPVAVPLTRSWATPQSRIRSVRRRAQRLMIVERVRDPYIPRVREMSECVACVGPTLLLWVPLTLTAAISQAQETSVATGLNRS